MYVTKYLELKILILIVYRKLQLKILTVFFLMNKKRAIILPFKESLNPKLAGAVSLFVKDTLNNKRSPHEERRISTTRQRRVWC